VAAGGNHINRFLRSAIALGLVAAGLLTLPGEPASAQELIRRQGFFERLFGGPPPRQALPPQGERPRRGIGILNREPRVAPPREREAAPARSSPRQRSNVARSAPTRAAPPPEVIEKQENARIVLVVGDFLASGLAEGLDAAYSTVPGVRVVDRSNGSSGFVRDDYYDWNAQIGGILDEVKPAAVVMMVGANDRQQLTIGGRSERPQTEAWRKEYTARVQAFAEKIKSAGVPLVWTGVPPFKSQSMLSDMLAFNDIYNKTAESVGGSFVDIWEGFVDENGAFASVGPDMNGQPVRLRGSDGINLTGAGKRKIAFYVEKPLAKVLGTAVTPGTSPEGNNAAQPALAIGEPVDLRRTQPISLSGPDLDGGTELLGATSRPSRTTRSEPSTQAGRADNFLLRRPATARTATPETTTAIEP